MNTACLTNHSMYAADICKPYCDSDSGVGVRPGVNSNFVQYRVGVGINSFLTTGVGAGVGVNTLSWSRSRSWSQSMIGTGVRVKVAGVETGVGVIHFFGNWSRSRSQSHQFFHNWSRSQNRSQDVGLESESGLTGVAHLCMTMNSVIICIFISLLIFSMFRLRSWAHRLLTSLACNCCCCNCFLRQT